MQMVGAKVVFESECNQNEGSQADKEQVSWILRLGWYRRSGMNVVNFIISKDLFENSILLIAYLV